MTIELAAPFLIGLLGSLHCLGMCGPLVMAYSLNLKSPETPAEGSSPSLWGMGCFHHLAYHLGRLMTYALLGALAAGFFEVIGFTLYLNIRHSLTLVGGVLIILLGLVLLKAIPLPGLFSRIPLPQGFLGNRFLPALFQSPGAISKMVLGLISGFLPCCLTASMLVTAATTEDMARGFMTMAAFGLGTVPALLAIGISASLLTLRTRMIGERLAALSVIALGLLLVLKGAKLLV
jgi:sulfite exporter TauE/SafE